MKAMTLTPPPQKNPNGRRKAGGTLVLYVDHDAAGAPVAYGRDAASGRPLWKWVFRYRGRAKNLACLDWRDAESESLKLIGAWDVEAATPRATTPSPEPVKGSTWRVSELIQQYIETSKGKRSASYIERCIAPYFVVTIGDPPVDRVTEQQYLKWRAQYVEAGGASMSTQKHRTDPLKQLVRYARRLGQPMTDLPDDFTPKLRLVSDGGDQREHYPLTDKELATLHGWLMEHAPPPAAFGVQLVAAIGLRDQEATHLRLQDVYLDAEVPHVHLVNFNCSCGYCKKNRGGKRRTKSGRERKVPLPPELVEPFRAYLVARSDQVPQGSVWVFPVWSAARCRNRRPGDQLDRSWFNDWLQRAVNQVGPKYDGEREQLVFHTLRSKADTDLDARSNGNETAVKVALGHKAGDGVKDRYNQLRKHLGLLARALYPDAYQDDLARQRGLKTGRRTA